MTRRELILQGAAALAAIGIPRSAWTLQDGEEIVEFDDYASAFRIEVRPENPRVKQYDLRELKAAVTPAGDFFVFHQTAIPSIDPGAWRLRVEGYVEKPAEFTLDDLKRRADARDVPVTIECSGNSPHPSQMNGLVGNAVWTGVGLASILKECGLKDEAREVVFLGMDAETERKWQSGDEEFTAPHGRSIYVQDALDPGALLAYGMNGRPLPPEHGFPLRLVLPGWYGMAQVKWLSRIYVLDRRYEGQHMARNYLGLRAVESGPEGVIWLDTSISRDNLKSVIARVTRRRTGNRSDYTISGAAWGGRAPIAGIEVQIDDGEWRPAVLAQRQGDHAWRLWEIGWSNPSSGPHTLVSRAIDVNGVVQPTLEELRQRLASGRENYAQWPRRITL